MSENLLSDEKQNRLLKLDTWKKMGVNPYPNRYERQDLSEDIKKRFVEGGEKEFPVKAAGRVMLLRDFGKAVFATLRDPQGNIQIYARKDILGDELFERFKLIDVGDIIGVEGDVFRTHKGEITILVKNFVLLAKALLGLPEKFHGLTDVEVRYRQRYLDLIVNEKVKQDFMIRFKMIQYIRRFLEDRGFLEVETPMMQTIPGGASARPFITHHNALDMDLYLRIAPELFLKRLIVGGFDRVFELNRNFRNEGIDTRHNPEFTMLELYQAYADYTTMMEIFETLMKELALHLKGSTSFTYQGKEVDFGKWKKIRYVDALKEYAGVDVSSIKTREDAVSAAQKAGIEEVDSYMGKWEILNLVFEEKVEPNLMEPVIIYEYPAEISPLAKYKEDDPEFVERFEPYAFGRELGNAFSELNDPFVQRERFLEQVRRKSQGDDEAMYMDEDYVIALEYGMPPTGGMGIGIDRLAMIFIDTASIRDTILFPTMKPITKD
ncbi:lysine--tRNA ligase [Thermospira aquatica]|uniref:Lysine--tRNA ligase n=1 Tax=Thermospira aquatica TaxID=2828656 RepID=A0AAX3BG33_9SPIR|nr:lysine--tRNA ligase [Thermospira aquatica]URA10989.1 lysine--tRNA ligase [Thermospira aquatica]